MAPKLATMETVGASMNIIIYGHMASGKTTLACQAQDIKEMSPVLVLDAEGGLKSVMHRGDIEFEKITSAEQLEDVLYKLLSRDKEYRKYKTVILDSVSEFQILNIEEIVRLRTKGQGDQSQVNLQDYGKSTKRLQKLFRELRDSPLNTIFVAFPNEVFTKGAPEGSPPEVIQPQLTNKLSKSLMGYVDYVWFLEFEEKRIRDKITKEVKIKTERRLYTRDSKKDETTIRAKTRGPNFQKALGAVVKNPNLVDIYNLYRSSEGEKTNG